MQYFELYLLERNINEFQETNLLFNKKVVQDVQKLKI